MKITKRPDTDRNKQRFQKRIRVPKIYGEAAKLVKKVNEGAGLRDTVFKINHPNIRGIYALACKAIKNDQLLESIITKTGMLNEKFDPDLAKILVAELLWGKQELKGESPPVKITLEFAEALKQAFKESSLTVCLTEGNFRNLYCKSGDKRRARL